LPGIATKDSNGFDTPVIRSKSTDVAGMFTQYSKVPSCDVTTVYEKRREEHEKKKRRFR